MFGFVVTFSFFASHSFSDLGFSPPYYRSLNRLNVGVCVACSWVMACVIISLWVLGAAIVVTIIASPGDRKEIDPPARRSASEGGGEGDKQPDQC